MTHQGVAVVTGGAIRVGAAIVRALVASGTRVWIHYCSSDADAEALRREIERDGHGPGILGLIPADLSVNAERTQLCTTVLDPDGPAGGQVDVLVNNAASFEAGPFVRRTDDDLRRVLELNLVAPLSLARQLAPALARGPGTIINIVDVAGLHPLRNYLDHCVAKAGLEMATRALAVELAPIRVNAVAPGTVAWPPTERYAEDSPARAAIVAQIPLGHIGTVQDVADAVVYLARASHVNGQCLVVDGGRIAAMGAERS